MFDSDHVNELARRWFTDSKAKKEVADSLRNVRLDEFAVEAEAVRLSLPDLELLDRMLSVHESRRNKSFRYIEDYRVGFARKFRDSSGRMLQKNEASTIEYRAKKALA
jgi:hypothetical protein